MVWREIEYLPYSQYFLNQLQNLSRFFLTLCTLDEGDTTLNISSPERARRLIILHFGIFSHKDTKLK